MKMRVSSVLIAGFVFSAYIILSGFGAQVYVAAQEEKDLATTEYLTEPIRTVFNDKVDLVDIEAEARDSNRINAKPSIFFDRPFYCPSVEVFWSKNASLIPMRITLIDRYIGSRFVKVKIFSSLCMKRVMLPKITPGVFTGSILANCLQLGESVLNATAFNIRYGDTITAEYAGHIQATAFVAFPEYVMDKEFVSLNPWKLFDSQGVPLVNYGQPIGIQYNPVTISQYALATYHMYMTTGNSTFREKFLVQANWLVKNAVQKGDFSVWEYHFDYSPYKLTNPWVSAMAQGEGLSVLTRAYVLTGNTSYLDLAETAICSFEVEMSSGGVRYTDSSGVWYEETADVGAPSSKILNGFIWALFGLYEYSFETNNSRGYALFWEGAHTLSANLYRYDTGSWSYYDLYSRTPASLVYHKHHIDQLMVLYKLTADQIFKEYSDRFNSYID